MREKESRGERRGERRKWKRVKKMKGRGIVEVKDGES